MDILFFQPNDRLINRLSLVLILMSAALLGIWSVKDTIALRNILLVLGAIFSISLMPQFILGGRGRAIGLNWFPAICIVMALFWVLSHYFFLSIYPSAQLHELTSIWLRSALATIFGLATGFALIRYPRLISIFWVALLFDFFVLFVQYLPYAWKLGCMIVPLDPVDFRRYLFIGKINPMYMGVLLISGSTGLLLDAINWGDKGWLRNTCVFWFVCLLTALYSFAFIINTRSGILLGSLPVIAWTLYGFLFIVRRQHGISTLQSIGTRKALFVLVIALALTGMFAKQQIQRDAGWQHLVEDIEIGYQIEKYPHWKNVGVYEFPRRKSGEFVAFNTYERVAWATAGVKSIPYHPYGVGVLLLPLGIAAKELFPGVAPLSTHSGWIDLTLSFGIPFICLMWLANASILYFAVRQKSPFKYTMITLSVILFALFILGELSNGHNLEILFYFFALMSGMQIAQKIKMADFKKIV